MDEYSYSVGFDEGYQSREQECEQCELFPRVIPKIPGEYIGKMKRNGGFTKTNPREWTDEEVAWILLLKQQGFSDRDIAESIGRTLVSVQVKLKRLSKSDRSYNADHIEDKYAVNTAFVEDLKPKTVLDAYCGHGSFYRSHFDSLNATTNDKDDEIEADYHMDAFSLMCKLYAEKRSFDIVDLDPFGSAFDCFDLAFKIARGGVAITFGEIGHKRWRRLDFVRTRYGIDSMEQFNTATLIKAVQTIAARNKKDAIVYAVREWPNISRVWFRIEPLKTTEQWGLKDE